MIAAGTRLGPYEIIAPIGAGGMGEVYKAHDTRLGRDVAVKILPAELAGNAQFRTRFEREAKTISRLSHPHICTLFDVGENYLVMELLEGESLADRVARGPLPLADVLKYGVQIAEALGKAHREGVIHRDLKPGNIMITKSGAKLLDFGLAKSTIVAGTPEGLTAQKPLTQEGTILGTFQYMAPEQLEGLEPDARTDIFALGAVLYEMATGKRAFEGKTKTSLIAAIVSADPKPMLELQPVTPRALEHVVRKCLAKDPEDRWQSASDVAEELRWTGEQPEVRPVGKTKRALVVTALASIVVAAAGGIVIDRIARTTRQPVVRFTIPTTEGPYRDAWIAIVSPDGKRLVFNAANRDGVRQLWVRGVDALDAKPIAGTENGDPLFGIDPRTLLIDVNGQLKKVDLERTSIETVCQVSQPHGRSINGDGTILYSDHGIIMIKRPNAPPQPLTRPDRAAKEVAHWWPTFLPDGTHFLYVARGEPSMLYLASIDSPGRIAVTQTPYRAVYADGYLFLVREKKLMAYPFDVKHGAIRGEGVVVADKINAFPENGWSAFSVADSGVLTYRIRTDQGKLLWLDQAGGISGSVGPIANYDMLRIAPDGKRVALAIEDPETERYHLWIYSLERPTVQRLTTGTNNEDGPVWSPDGKRVAYAMWDPSAEGKTSIRIHALGDQAEDLEVANAINAWPNWWDLDGTLFFDAQPPGARLAEWSVRVGEKGSPAPYLRSAFNVGGVQSSPDGRWIVFVSNESGRGEVYVRAKAAGQEKVQVSLHGGRAAHWSRDGRRIYFLAGRSMMAANVRADAGKISVAEPRQLFQIPFSVGDFDVAPDGRFLVIAPEEGEAAPTAVIVNWQQALKERR